MYSFDKGREPAIGPGCRRERERIETRTEEEKIMMADAWEMGR